MKPLDPDQIVMVAQARNVLHGYTGRFYEDKDIECVIGIAGEMRFSLDYNVPMDWELRPEGDNGVDFWSPGGETVDVKTARKPSFLLVKQETMQNGCADLLVLAKFHDITDVRLLGWATRLEMAQRPVTDMGGFGILSHWMPADELHPMETFEPRFLFGPNPVYP